MNTNTTSDFVSVNKDIKQISQALLEESKTNKTPSIHYYRDETNNEPGICYKRFESIPLMGKAGFIEVVLPVKKSRHLRNLFPNDMEIVENPIYKVKRINPIELAKFILNPNIELFIKKEVPSLIHNAGDVILQHGKLSIIKNTENTVFLYYEGLSPSKPISKKAAWFKVFFKFMENTRLEKQEIMAKWNLTEKNKFGSIKKVRNDNLYVTKVRQQILDGLLGKSSEIAKLIRIEKGKGSFRNSYNLEVD